MNQKSSLPEVPQLVSQVLTGDRVDDLLQRWTKQIVLTIVARLAHGFSPTANLAVKGTTKPPNPESQNKKTKTCPRHSYKIEFLLTSVTATDQSLPNSSRTTSSSGELISFHDARS
jgi:hypothetical protein